MIQTRTPGVYFTTRYGIYLLISSPKSNTHTLNKCLSWVSIVVRNCNYDESHCELIHDGIREKTYNNLNIQIIK